MPDGSRMRYFGTTTEVALGDVVQIKRWFRTPLHGVVCYIPGLSRCHPDLENDDGKQWVIELADGILCPMGYDPENRWGQPNKSIAFVRRGSTLGIAETQRVY